MGMWLPWRPCLCLLPLMLLHIVDVWREAISKAQYKQEWLNGLAWLLLPDMVLEGCLKCHPALQLFAPGRASVPACSH